MDILSHILNSAGLEKILLTQETFYQPWAMKFPCHMSMGFHVISQGEAQLHFTESKNHKKKTILLKGGDIVLVKRGCQHELNTTSTSLSITKKPLLTLVSGLYQFKTEPIHPLFKEFPNIILIRAEDIPVHSSLSALQQLLYLEVSRPGPGSEAIAKSLIDIIFHYILRDWLENKNDINQDKKMKTSLSWSAALKDPHLKKVMGVLHAEPNRNWNVEELASVASLSRAAFAKKFKSMTGETPAHYLTQIRIQLSMDLLRTTHDSLDKVAESVGYSDSYVFSKAFKRILGHSPKKFKEINKLNSNSSSLNVPST